MDRGIVEVGQRFESLRAFRRIWEVEAVYKSGENIAHAQLSDVKDRATRSTLSISALLDETRFRRLKPEEIIHQEVRDPRSAVISLNFGTPKRRRSAL